MGVLTRGNSTLTLLVWLVASILGFPQTATAQSVVTSAQSFFDDFTSGPSSLWQNELGSWVASGGVYYATGPTTLGQYVRSTIGGGGS